MTLEDADNPRWTPWLVSNGAVLVMVWLGWVEQLPGMATVTLVAGGVMVALMVVGALATRAYHRGLLDDPTRDNLARVWLMAKNRSVAERYPMMDRAYDLGLLTWAAHIGSVGLFVLVLAMALLSEVIRRERLSLRGTLEDLLGGGQTNDNTTP